ncbi:ankyrin repeat domain-containing protein [Simkania sp.]|uniref:ankyrin repeat domain-containing protein n=1 Tax=Simkania sp. TaxID=34094 RepID=UPI003B51CE44
MVIQAGIQAYNGVLRFIQRPYEESIRQRQYALYGLFSETVPKGSEFLPSLTGRVTHLVISLLLHPAFFVLSNILYHVMHHYALDSGRQFCQAIEDGDKKQLDFFLKIGWNPNQRFQGKPLIFIAYEKKQIKVLKRLLKQESCDSNLTWEGKTLYHLAAKNQDQETIRLLSSNGANPSAKQSTDHFTPALITYLEGNADLALEIVDQSHLVNNFVDRSKNTLLNYAWEKKDYPMVEKLIQRGATPPTEKKLSHYDVMSLIYERKKELIETQMVRAGWDVNAADKDGHTILEKAVDDRDWSFARVLVKNGAHITTLRPNGTRLITFEQFQNDADYYREFLEDSDFLPTGRKRWNPRNWLSGEKYLDWAIPSLVERAKRKDFNPLEKVFFMASDQAMQRLACCLSYSEFVQDLAALQIKYGRIQTDWILNALYEVNHAHYGNFEDKTIEAEAIESPPKHIFLHTLVEEFKKLGELSEEERTFQGHLYSPEELEQCLRTLISTVTQRRSIEGLPADPKRKEALFKRLELTLRQIAYYLRYDGNALSPIALRQKALRELAHDKDLLKRFDKETPEVQVKIGMYFEKLRSDPSLYYSKDIEVSVISDESIQDQSISPKDPLAAQVDQAILKEIQALEGQYRNEEKDNFQRIKRSALLDLAYAGHCARDWHIVLYQIYCMLANRDYQILTFDDRIMIDLGKFRLELLQNHIYKGQRGAYKYALSMIGETRGIPAEPPDPEDLPTDINRTRMEEENRFDQYYQPNMLVKAVLETRNKDEYFQEYMLNYFREVISKRWIEGPYKQVKREISQMSDSKALSGKQVQDFFARHGVELPEKLNGRDVTVQSGLDYSRFMDCYGEVLSLNPQETLPMGIAKMLESMGYLRTRNSGIFKKSFGRTWSEWVKRLLL